MVRRLTYLENGSTWQTVLRTVRQRKDGGTVRQRNDGGTVGAFLVLGIRYIFVVNYGGRDAKLEILNGCV